jgi:hypothetical protein
MPYAISSLKCWDATNITALFENFQCGRMEGHEILLVFSFSGYLGHNMQYQQSVHIFEEIFKY